MFQFIKIKNFVLNNTIYRKYQTEYLNHINKVFKNTSINNNQNDDCIVNVITDNNMVDFKEKESRGIRF